MAPTLLQKPITPGKLSERKKIKTRDDYMVAESEELLDSDVGVIRDLQSNRHFSNQVIHADDKVP